MEYDSYLLKLNTVPGKNPESKAYTAIFSLEYSVLKNLPN